MVMSADYISNETLMRLKFKSSLLSNRALRHMTALISKILRFFRIKTRYFSSEEKFFNELKKLSQNWYKKINKNKDIDDDLYTDFLSRLSGLQQIYNIAESSNFFNNKKINTRINEAIELMYKTDRIARKKLAKNNPPLDDTELNDFISLITQKNMAELDAL